MNTTTRFRLIDRAWEDEFQKAARLNTDDLLIVCPFIKEGPIRRMTANKSNVRVLTRFSPAEIWEGVSDIAAFQHLLDSGAETRGVKNLHAKLYVFGTTRAIVTSANLTEAALTRNHELGFVSEDAGIIESCRNYFENLWGRAGALSKSLTKGMLKAWEAKLAAAGGRSRRPPGLSDEGANLGFLPDASPVLAEPSISTQAFVKFFGTSTSRGDRDKSILEEIAEHDSNWALSYPANKRPRQVSTGDVMFISRLMHSPNDTLIYGRAIAYEHVQGRDDATRTDIARIWWRKEYSAFIRIREPEFIAGTLANGISLFDLMDELGHETFVSTDENYRAKNGGNTNPRIALRSKAHMPLTQKAADLLNARFYEAIANHGRLSPSAMKKLHWEPLPIV
jgi:hypothetical protein